MSNTIEQELVALSVELSLVGARVKGELGGRETLQKWFLVAGCALELLREEVAALEEKKRI